MYQNRFVTAVKHNGRVLRELGETVFLPFGCEYSLMFKNLNSVRALVRVSIDGTNATEGADLIVPANDSVDLERFIVSGNMNVGHRFKFIERTGKIENGPRGIKADDGLIRVEFEFERPYVQPSILNGYLPGQNQPVWPPVRDLQYPYTTWTTTTATYSAPTKSAKSALRSMASPATLASSASTTSASVAPQNTALNGITVAGSESRQQFVAGARFPTDGVKHVMVLCLMGEAGEVKVEKPVTVKTKTECPTCGTKNKFGTKFCRECGTSLAIL
jgi:hypothetical protein